MRTSLGIARLAFAAVLTAGSTLTLACGYCLEDRIATVYDHAVVKSAAATKREVAFFLIEGAAATDEAAQRVVTSALTSAGATKASVRVSIKDGACSAAYDPARTSAPKIAQAVNATLSARGIRLALLRAIDTEGTSRKISAIPEF